MSNARIYEMEFTKKFPNIDLSDYFDFIEKNKLNESVKFETANHHILPKWAFPEFTSFPRTPWNKSILSHKNHLIAHFMLWESWHTWQNATPLMVMFNSFDRNNDIHDELEKFIPLYELACVEHGKSVSNIHTGKFVREETRDKLRGPRLASKNMYRVICIETGENLFITTEEYHKGKNILYKSHQAGRPAWNTGKKMDKTRNKLSVWDKTKKERVFITSSEYLENKDLYIHPSSGKSTNVGLTIAKNKETGETEQITCEEYKNSSLYESPISELIWCNNGITSKRVKKTEIPEGFSIGRIKNAFLKMKKKTVTCPYCGKTGGKSNMVRYKNHFEHCKSKPD